MQAEPRQAGALSSYLNHCSHSYSFVESEISSVESLGWGPLSLVLQASSFRLGLARDHAILCPQVSTSSTGPRAL
jgi:hypothetical protein